ncbi:FIG002958: hypothetical protein [plant metagenome]|uniref:Uncharacterized protein n=1 Tax=plant metagenome TaxID=1297885 RepID=A0A484P6U0_9ZZZZ
MPLIEFTLQGDYIEVNQLLKLAGLCTSGGEGKQWVAEGRVRVGGEIESRKTAKIRAGQIVDCDGTRIVVRAAPAEDAEEEGAPA